MKKRFLISSFLYLSLSLLGIAEDTVSSKPDTQTDTETKSEIVRVSVLGYHDFTSSSQATEMLLPVAKLRSQLDDIKNNNLNVITLEAFIAWKKGEKNVPDRSILITIDDGWKSVYTEAFPVFKEFNYPFTLYLYKNYVDGGGRALTTPMIQEMLDSGLCTIGSHSVSHPFPSKFKSMKKKGKESYNKFLDTEFGLSKSFLEEKFSTSISTYAYPGGYHTEEMYEKAEKFNYDMLFTVIPGKVKRDSPNHTLNRYIVLGTHDNIFKYAITFKNLSSSEPNATALVIKTDHPVTPAPAASVESRTPTISVDLSEVKNLDHDSVEMRIAGFGKVPCKINADTQEASWTVNRPIHTSSVEVHVTWKLQGKTKAEPPIKWTFLIDKAASYQPVSQPSPQAEAK